MENSKKFGEIGEMGWPTTMGVGKWRIRRNMKNSEKWAGRPWGSGSGEFEEIWRNRRNGLVDDHGGREVENSKKYEEFGEMGWSTTGGQGSGEFEEI